VYDGIWLMIGSKFESRDDFLEDNPGNIFIEFAIQRNVLIEGSMFSRFQNDHIMFGVANCLIVGRLAVGKINNVVMIELPESIDFELVIVVELGVEKFCDVNLIIPCQLKQT
jgi:hypothetical protein